MGQFLQHFLFMHSLFFFSSCALRFCFDCYFQKPSVHLTYSMTKKTVIDYNGLAEVVNRLLSLPPAFLPHLFLPPCLHLCRVRFWFIVLYARTVSGKRIFQPSTLFILFIFYIKKYSWPHCTARGDLSSPTRNRILAPCIGRQIINHWTTRELPDSIHFHGIFNSQERAWHGRRSQDWKCRALLSPLHVSPFHSSAFFCASSMSSAKKNKRTMTCRFC